MFTQTPGGHSPQSWTYEDAHQVCHCVKLPVHTSCAPQYSTNTKNVPRVALHDHKKFYDENL